MLLIYPGIILAIIPAGFRYNLLKEVTAYIRCGGGHGTH